MNEFYGIIAEKYHEEDYLLGNIGDLPVALGNWREKKIQYNQKIISSVSCTIHAAMGAYSDLTGYIFSETARHELWKTALLEGANPNVGWYVPKAVDLIRHDINRWAKIKISSYRLVLGSADFVDALQKGYSVITGYRGNREYNLDKADGVLDNTSFGKATYGHCIRITKIDDGKFVIDNYFGENIPNSYCLADLKKLIENRIFFTNGYIFLVKTNNTEKARRARRAPRIKKVTEYLKSWFVRIFKS